MSVQAINSVNNIQHKPVQSPIEPKKFEQKESIANGTTLLLGSLAALAVGTGIYFATKGRGGKSVTGGTSSVTDGQKPFEILKEYTLDAFKKAGHRFEKGKALTSDGKNYTGTLTRVDKKGNKFVSEFKDGVFQKATNNNEVISEVTFKDNIKTIKTKISNIKFNTEIGKIITLQQTGKGIKQFHYTKDGVLKYVDHYFDESGTTGVREITKYASDGKLKLFTTRLSSAKLFDNNGKVVDEINIDLLRGGNSYYYKGLNYNYDKMTGTKDYTVLNPKTQICEAWLSKVDRPDFKSNSLRLNIDEKKYTIDLDTNHIVLNGGEEITDKALIEKILTRKNQIIKEINEIDKDAMNIKTQLQEAIRDVDKSGSSHIVA